MRILMVGADPMEFPGIAGRGSLVRPAGLPVNWSRHLELAGNSLLLVANGAGARRAAAAVDAGLAAFSADAIVSLGFCGALDERLNIADVVTADYVAGYGKRWPARVPQCSRTHTTGTVVSIDRVAQTAAEKRQLRAAGAIAVEMEAASVAERANARSIPFYCVRVVSDLAGEDMANDFNKALRDDGHFATINILTGICRKPLVRLPELLRLRKRCVLAARLLGDFIADCRF
jgi:nucleoside phosphorylase